MGDFVTVTIGRGPSMTLDQMLQLIQIGFVIVALIAGVAGWFLREMWTAVQNLKIDVSKLREALPKEYVQKDDYKGDIGRILTTLDKIYGKLDNKVDR